MRAIIIFFLITNFIFSQENESKVIYQDTLYKPNYPEGIYLSKDDFIHKRANTSNAITMRTLNIKKVDSTLHNGYFYYLKTGKKVKKVFAISYKGHLYFQIKAILKNRNKTDRAQTSNFDNSFVRVILGGENYFYTEAKLVNQWAQGVAYNFGAVGGIIASDLIKGKGIVWDFKNEEFNIFKNCKDYNEFIKEKSPNDIQKCEKHQPNMFEVRKAIDKIKG